MENPTKRFCWWIVVFFMCAHEISYVYSHVCARAPCLDDNPVRKLDISAFATLSQQSSFKSGQHMLPRDDAGQSLARTQVHMSSRSSVQNHWHFQHYLQSLCLPVLHAARNRTKIVPWSFPMSLFLGSTVWSSLLILSISCHETAAALNSWTSRL